MSDELKDFLAHLFVLAGFFVGYCIAWLIGLGIAVWFIVTVVRWMGVGV